MIFVGILERVVDDLNRENWQPQMEGGKAARELPGIVDQVVSMSLFVKDGDGWRHDPAKGQERRLVFAVPATPTACRPRTARET